ncbi:winged helix-turn-helix transcriptional regulator [Nitrosopumilus maritimus]|uniref:Transcriptional regulator, ArsR family n=1 Tax=Nitrosopumilus maritimus (strain SCM1) TaxID=436308 RepID=A9A1J8_NITMS|nr:winged helix-turn-helix transcriptional regulator [Nitrosopumilus maritimus]ABX13177.1 transcriptional regulator, ArsR family [Nitrosopumilus maritimus SCM1]
MSDRESMLTEIIHKNPGLHYSEIIRVSGLKNGVLSYYLTKLESNGTIKIEREKNKTRFFTPTITHEEIRIIVFLRKETSRRILSVLSDSDGLKFKRIVEKVGKSAPTISQNLSKLIASDLVVLKLENSEKKYYLKRNSTLKKLIKKCQINNSYK